MRRGGRVVAGRRLSPPPCLLLLHFIHRSAGQHNQADEQGGEYREDEATKLKRRFNGAFLAYFVGVADQESPKPSKQLQNPASFHVRRWRQRPAEGGRRRTIHLPGSTRRIVSFLSTTTVVNPPGTGGLDQNVTFHSPSSLAVASTSYGLERCPWPRRCASAALIAFDLAILLPGSFALGDGRCSSLALLAPVAAASSRAHPIARPTRIDIAG